MWLILFRSLVVLALGWAGWHYTPVPGQEVLGLALGVAFALLIIGLELRLHRVPAHHMVGALVGGVTGLLGAHLVWGVIAGLQLEAEHFIHSILIVFLIYMGIVIGARRGEWFEPARIVAAFKDASRLHQYKVLDTSVIIDGRIADICETGFLDGTLVVPQFVLRELQQVADSSDSMKRNRGRRGLDVLQRVQKMTNVHVQIVETDFPEVKEVDLKLIELAKRLSGKIVTNDFNLNKVAQLRGVAVLNINELANSLKPVVLPGEVLRVFVLKEGKEPGQGVAYLDDGTMVVVDQGKRAIGRTVEVTVTSVLQTTAGKMIFCRWPEAQAGSAEGEARREPRPPERREERRDSRNDRDHRGEHRRDSDRREPGERPAAEPPRPEGWPGRRARGARPGRQRALGPGLAGGGAGARLLPRPGARRPAADGALAAAACAAALVDRSGRRRAASEGPGAARSCGSSASACASRAGARPRRPRGLRREPRERPRHPRGLRPPARGLPHRLQEVALAGAAAGLGDLAGRPRPGRPRQPLPRACAASTRRPGGFAAARASSSSPRARAARTAPCGASSAGASASRSRRECRSCRCRSSG